MEFSAWWHSDIKTKHLSNIRFYLSRSHSLCCGFHLTNRLLLLPQLSNASPSISRLCKHTNSCNIPPCAHISQRHFSSSSVHCPHVYLTSIACIASTPSKQFLQFSDALSSPFQASVSIQAAAITSELLQCNNETMNLLTCFFDIHQPSILIKSLSIE